MPTCQKGYVWDKVQQKCVVDKERAYYQGPCDELLYIRIFRREAINPTTPVGPLKRVTGEDFALVAAQLTKPMRAAKVQLAAKRLAANAKMKKKTKASYGSTSRKK